MAIHPKLRTANPFKELQGVIQTSSRFAHLGAHLDKIDTPEGGFQLAPQVFANITQGAAKISPWFASALVNVEAQAAQADNAHVMNRVVAGCKAIFTKREGEKGLFIEAPLPIELDVLKSELMKANDPEIQNDWFLEGIYRLGVIPRNQISNGIQMLRERVDFLCSIFLHPTDDREFSINCKNPSKSRIDIEVDVPLSVKELSGEDLQNIAARALTFYVIKKYLASDARGAFSTFMDRKITTLPSFAHVKPELESITYPGITFYTNSIFKSERTVNSLHMMLSWLFGCVGCHNVLKLSDGISSKVLQTNDSTEAAIRKNISRLKKNADFESYWKHLVSGSGMLETIAQPMTKLPIPPYGITIRIDDSKEGIGISLSGNEVQRNVSFHLSLDHDTLSKMKSEDFLRLLWRISSLQHNRRRDLSFHRDFIRTDSIGDYELLKMRLGDYTGERLTLEDLRDEIDFMRDERRDFAYMLLLFQHYQFSQSSERDLNRIQVKGNLKLSSQKSFATVLKAIGSFLKIDTQESAKVAWEGVMKMRSWFLGEGESSDDATIVEVTPVNESDVIIFIKGNSWNLTSLDWLFVLCSVTANGDRSIRIGINKKSREIVNGGSHKLAELLYNTIASNPLFSPYNLYDKGAKKPPHIDLELPGGIRVSENPNFVNAKVEDQRAYLSALRWFAQSDVPDGWQPKANDSESTIKSKFRQMAKAWHPDLNRATPEQMKMFTKAQDRWSVVQSMHAGMK
ncbi:MAG: J domain-containing protein [Pseudomonadota bacterium]